MLPYMRHHTIWPLEPAMLTLSLTQSDTTSDITPVSLPVPEIYMSTLLQSAGYSCCSCYEQCDRLSLVFGHIGRHPGPGMAPVRQDMQIQIQGIVDAGACQAKGTVCRADAAVSASSWGQPDLPIAGVALDIVQCLLMAEQAEAAWQAS